VDNDNDPDERAPSWMTRLVEEMGRAAQTGNVQTARLMGLLAVAAAAVALVILASR